MSASPATPPPRGGILGSWVVLGSLHRQVEHLARAVGALWVGVTPHAKLDTHHWVGLILGGSLVAHINCSQCGNCWGFPVSTKYTKKWS